MPNTTMKSFHSQSVENPDFAIHPRFWTVNHLSMVKCNFQQIETDDAHGPGSLDTQTAERLAVSAKKLSVGVVPGSKFFWAENLLLRKGTSPITFSKAPLSFYYGQRRVRLADSYVHTFRIKDEISIPHADPMIGYYRYSADEERREKLRAPRAIGFCIVFLLWRA
ncbi:hypothetical protein FOC1_g10007916 [Fusarium oxysporum f. sp. cubense race 1]|uniref:Uncharacterized protein n=1 Tax=Fusarium oxysporum f. sp. cubense (strain race 1) TaxID=1229664 RepID=N4TX54_FUSC1|nr:hypothetical protein FOC1_g10007916 [Fusarium oxysporum f. sp. cubense race 1]